MAYPIPSAFAAELKLWREHFAAEGDSPPRADEHARAAVTGIYLRDDEPAPVEADDNGPAPVFVARPLDVVPSASLPPFRWADAVPLPPEGAARAGAQGDRAHDGEPRANGPTDVGGVAGGWRAA